mmetsp:Transcript_81523/g.236362  ORF Transcript_81523/g.236362 Transcript_81523/m.236362 type:complete len:205 (+) Transcript_81523:474-1088(+)
MRPRLVPTTMPHGPLSSNFSQAVSTVAEITSSSPTHSPLRSHFVEMFQTWPSPSAANGRAPTPRDRPEMPQTATRCPRSWITRALHSGSWASMKYSSMTSRSSHSTTTSPTDWPSMGRHAGVGLTRMSCKPSAVRSSVAEYIWNSSVNAKCRPVESHDKPHGWKFSLGQSTRTRSRGLNSSSCVPSAHFPFISALVIVFATATS